MKIEYIRNQKEIEKEISEVEKQSPSLRDAIKDGVGIMHKLYLYSPLEKVYFPSELGLESDFGGRVFKIAKVRNRNLYYLVDSLHTVIGFFKEIKEEVKKDKEENFGVKMSKIRAEKKKQK